jgi:hypothetical protein
MNVDELQAKLDEANEAEKNEDYMDCQRLAEIVLYQSNLSAEPEFIALRMQSLLLLGVIAFRSNDVNTALDNLKVNDNSIGIQSDSLCFVASDNTILLNDTMCNAREYNVIVSIYSVQGSLLSSQKVNSNSGKIMVKTCSLSIGVYVLIVQNGKSIRRVMAMLP